MTDPRPAPMFIADAHGLDFLNTIAAPWGSDIEWLGMAQAFLSRGSEWAIGTVRKVGDELAADIAIRFFAKLVQNADPQTALRAAVIESGRQPVSRRAQLTPENDIGAIRVYGP